MSRDSERPVMGCAGCAPSDVGVRAALAAGMTDVHIPDVVPSQDLATHHEADSLMAATVWAELVAPRVSPEGSFSHHADAGRGGRRWRVGSVRLSKKEEPMTIKEHLSDVSQF